uniref:Ig-like domain-containing protein n=1 Tax=Oncorhynchus mykiss TaxID=8022 RepID=A0A8C7SZU5_ONCMY
EAADVDVLPLRLAVVESSNPLPGEELGPAVTGLVGDPVSLPCEASGTPRVEVNWVLPGGRVVGSRNEGRRKDEAGVTVLANGTLSLPIPALGDAGLYRCLAVNQYGADSLSTRLTLTPRPSDTSSRMRYPMRPPSVAGVSKRGLPVPLLSWVLPDLSVLTPDPNPNPALGTHPRVSIFPNGTLRILVAGPADRGLYRCVASNLAGAGSLSVRLHVSSLPPAIQEPREEKVTRPAGLPLYAQCSARGAPPPSIRWRTPDGTFLLPSQFLNGNLFDSGSYECLATNAVGGDKRTVRVEVTGDGGGGEVVSMDKMTFSSINSKFDLPPSSPVLNPPLPPSSPLITAVPHEEFSFLWPPPPSKSPIPGLVCTKH